MKKILRLVAMVIALCMLLGTLASCESCKKEEEVIEGAEALALANQLKAQSDAYYQNGTKETATITGSMIGLVNGVSFDSQITATTVTEIRYPNAENFAYRSEETSKIVTTMNGSSETEESVISEIFAENCMYYSYTPINSSESATRLSSVCTAAEYQELLDFKARNTPSFDSFQSIQLKKDEEAGNWILTLADINKSDPSIKQWASELLAAAFPTKMEIQSCKMVYTIRIDTGALIKEKMTLRIVTVNSEECNLEFLLSGEAKVESVSESGSFKPENLGSYTQTHDLRYIDYAEAAFSALSGSENASFRYNTEQNVQRKVGNNFTSLADYKENGSLQYGRQNGLYRYVLEYYSQVDNESRSNAKVIYDGTRLYAKSGNEEQVAEASEFRARMTLVSGLLSHFVFSSNDVQTVELTDEGENTNVNLTLDATEDAASMFSSMGLDASKLKNATNTMSFVLDADKNLVSAQYRLDASLVNGSTTYILNIDLTFKNIGTADFSDMVIPASVGASTL